MQRHSSWEHTLLGDTPPSELGRAAITRADRQHVLAEEWSRMMFFSRDPGGDPRSSFPNVRWVQLRASGLWVSNGELNALADYLPDPSASDTLPRETIVPVLQRMRSGIRGQGRRRIRGCAAPLWLGWPSTGPWFGLPDAEVMSAMGSVQQPGIAGMNRYGVTPSSGTSEGDRAFGRSAIDPQTAQERKDREGRVAGSGVSGTGPARERNYQAYLRFLNSGFLQKAAGAAHDYFNQRGLTVANGAGTEMRVGGDDTMLSQSNQIGAETAGEAARLSRQAIDDLANTGTTSVTVDQIFQLVPQFVIVTGAAVRKMPLADWQEDVLHDICNREIFPDVVSTFSENTAVRAFGAEMVAGGISVDSGKPPPPEASGPVGDFPPVSTGVG